MTRETPELDIGALNDQSACLIGVDEAGRGPLAGPVVAAACVLGAVDVARVPAGLNDSKKLSAKRRATLEQGIRESSLFAIGVVEPTGHSQLSYRMNDTKERPQSEV